MALTLWREAASMRHDLNSIHHGIPLRACETQSLTMHIYVQVFLPSTPFAAVFLAASPWLPGWACMWLATRDGVCGARSAVARVGAHAQERAAGCHYCAAGVYKCPMP